MRFIYLNRLGSLIVRPVRPNSNSKTIDYFLFWITSIPLSARELNALESSIVLVLSIVVATCVLVALYL